MKAMALEPELGHCQGHRANLARTASGTARLALSRLRPVGATRLDESQVEGNRDRPASQVLLLDLRGTRAARKGSRELVPPLGSYQSGLGDNLVDPEEFLFCSSPAENGFLAEFRWSSSRLGTSMNAVFSTLFGG